MRKKNINLMADSIIGFIMIICVTVVVGCRVFATQTCTADSNTGVITCSDSGSATASVIVATSCSFAKDGTGNYSEVLANNSSKVINATIFTTTCNSPNGYALYATGFSGDVLGETDLIANIGSTYNIHTGNGDSNWKMQIASTGDYGTVVPTYDPGSDGNSYADIPSGYTKVAYYTPAPNDTSTQSVFQAKYKVSASSTQPAGTYIGQVKYTLIPTNDSISKSIFELEYMQDFASLSAAQKTDVLKSMITNEQYQLKDSRDEKTYYISKMADNNVWMTQNLDHDIVTTTNFYTPANTDIPSNWTASTATTKTTTWEDSYTAPMSYDPGNYCWNGIIDYDGGSLDNMTVTCTDQTANKHYAIGNYYNWTAAVAMNDSSAYTNNMDAADQSICPAGWRLPTYSGSKSYDNLLTNKVTSGEGGNIHLPPLYFAYAGDWAGDFNDNIGYTGVYLSSAIYDSRNVYAAVFINDGSDTLDSHYDVYRDTGSSVRCVLR